MLYMIAIRLWGATAAATGLPRARMIDSGCKLEGREGMLSALDGPHRASAEGAPDSLVVLLHGRGSNGEDLIGLADFWTEAFPHAMFHAPNAPYDFEGGPFGYQWYSSGRPELRREGLDKVSDAVNTYLDGLLDQYGLDSSRCVLVGFSQGTMLSLHLAPRRHKALAGVVGFSGAMSTSDTLKEELANKTPICLIVGTNDTMIPPERSEAAAKLLAELDVPHELHILPGLGHSIDRRGLEHASHFMNAVLGTHQARSKAAADPSR